tara:strand:- start:16171 stop:16521 length:351 start_codon:yes stop_codon:yes gene_type:complete
MSGPSVQLQWAYSWECPRCRRVVFGEFPTPPKPLNDIADELTEEERAKVEPWADGQADDDVFFMVVPAFVICPHCRVEFFAHKPVGLGMADEDEDEFDDHRDDWSSDWDIYDDGEF